MNFDLMRLVAALLVVVSHTFPLAGQAPFRIMGVEDLGALGVSVFFVLSGYLVSASYERDPKSYLLKRILRIEPGLIASLVVTVVLLAFVTTAPAAMKQYSPSLLPQMMVALAPIVAPRFTRVGRNSFLRSISARGTRRWRSG